MLEQNESLDGLLRRRTVRPATRRLYERVGGDFLAAHGLNVHSPVADLDTALDAAIVALFLTGEAPAEANILFYAVRWLTCRTNSDFRLAYQSRRGHARSQRGKHIEPESWEATLLMSLYLLRSVTGREERRLAALAAAGFLLSFDLYCRGTDIVTARRSELRPPEGPAAGLAAGAWSLTLFPVGQSAESKTGRQDQTKIVGATDPRRRWLNGICRALKRHPPPSQLLLGLTEAKYVDFFHRARRLAQLPASHPRRLRHGGASADALVPGITDAAIQERGPWASVKSVLLYRLPARYLRQLALLSSSQKLLAARCHHELTEKIVAYLK